MSNNQENINCVNVYAPDRKGSKERGEREKYYEKLQAVVDKIEPLLLGT